MKENTLLSIVVPVYNVERYIRKCLDSITRQNLENIEIIMVNDGSTDNSLKICEEYACVYKNFFTISQANAGLSSARNTGIKAAKGKYILFLDSDDFLKEGVLSNIICDISHTSADFFLGRAYKYYEDSDLLELCQLDYATIKANSPSKFFIKLDQQKHFWFAAWLVIIDRKFLLDNQLFFHTGILHEDELWVPSVFVIARTFSLLNYGFYCYRINRKGSIVFSNNIKREFDKLTVVDELEKFRNKTSDSNKLISARQAAIVFGEILMLFKYKNDELYLDLKKGISCRKNKLLSRKYFVIYVLSKFCGVENVSLFLKYLF